MASVTDKFDEDEFPGMDPRNAPRKPSGGARKPVTPPPYEGMEGKPKKLTAVPRPTEEQETFEMVSFDRFHVLQALPPYEEVQEVLDTVEHEMNYMDFLAALCRGEHTLYRWDEGWCTVALWNGWIDIICMSNTNPKILKQVFDNLQNDSKKFNLRGLRFMSPREGAYRKATENGFVTRNIEYLRANDA